MEELSQQSNQKEELLKRPFLRIIRKHADRMKWYNGGLKKSETFIMSLTTEREGKGEKRENERSYLRFKYANVPISESFVYPGKKLGSESPTAFISEIEHRILGGSYDKDENFREIFDLFCEAYDLGVLRVFMELEKSIG